MVSAACVETAARLLDIDSALELKEKRLNLIVRVH